MYSYVHKSWLGAGQFIAGQNEEYLLEILMENYKRLRDVPDNLIMTLLEYRGYTGKLVQVENKT